MPLERGFKANAERISIELRAQMSIEPEGFLNAFLLAEHLEVSVLEPVSYFENEKILEFLNIKNSGWSALTVFNKHNRPLVFYNCNHSFKRQQSDIMHELSHILCKHDDLIADTEYSSLSSMLRVYNTSQEEEAIAMGAILQAPRIALYKFLKMGYSINQISEQLQASEALVKFRLNNSGVKKQLSSLKNKY